MRIFKTCPWILTAYIIIVGAQITPLQPVSPPVPGSPLSEDEYRAFWQLLKPKEKSERLCEIRQNYGCDDPRIERVDLFENHGLIPEGTVCTELEKFKQFYSFCHFAQFRCSSQRFFLRRIPCEDALDVSPDSTESRSLQVKASSPVLMYPDTLGLTDLPPGFLDSNIEGTRKRAIPTTRPTSTSHLNRNLNGLPGHISTHIDKLIQFSFSVCDQKPLRRNKPHLLATTKSSSEWSPFPYIPSYEDV